MCRGGKGSEGRETNEMEIKGGARVGGESR